MSNQTATDSTVLYYILNGYGVTATYLITNIITLVEGIWIIYLNYLVISTLLRQRNSIEVADIYVASLSGADFLTGIFLLYNTAYTSINYQSSDECRFRFGLLILLAICSGTHLLFLAFDRFIKILRPLHYNTMFTQRSVVIICSLIWLYAFIIGILPSMGWKNDFEETNNDSVKCTFFGTLNDDYISLVNIVFWLPVALMLLLYLCIFKVAHRHAKVIALQERALNFQRQERSEKQSWKFTKTISIIVGLYTLMWTPIAITFIIHLEGYIDYLNNSQKGVILLYVSTPAFINSLLDPIIYAFKIPSVKTRFRKVFSCCVRKRRPSRMTVSVAQTNSVKANERNYSNGTRIM